MPTTVQRPPGLGQYSVRGSNPQSPKSPRDGSRFLVTMQAEARDRAGLLSELTQAMSDQRVSILSESVTTPRDPVAVIKFTLEVGDPNQLGRVLRAMRSVDGVYDVYRVAT